MPCFVKRNEGMAGYGLGLGTADVIGARLPTTTGATTTGGW